MKYQVQLFHIDRDAKASEQPQPAGGFEIIADTKDGARVAVLGRLQSEGRHVRSLSFLADGELVSVVTEPSPAPSAAQVRRAKGGR
jgi:hypothetical protein